MSDHELIALAKIDVAAAKAVVAERAPPSAVPVDEIEDDGFVTVYPQVHA